MIEIDPNKMKVAELREELKTRGLDTKGTKAVLVKRLQQAINKEQGISVADDESLGDGAVLEEEAPDESSQDLDGGKMDKSAVEIDGNEDGDNDVGEGEEAKEGEQNCNEIPEGEEFPTINKTSQDDEQREQTKVADDESLGDGAVLEEEAPDESSRDLDGGKMDKSALEVDNNEDGDNDVGEEEEEGEQNCNEIPKGEEFQTINKTSQDNEQREQTKDGKEKKAPKRKHSHSKEISRDHSPRKISLSKEERIFIVLKMAQYNESIVQVQRMWKQEINQNPPSHVTIRETFKRFKATGSVEDLPRSGRPNSLSEIQSSVTIYFQQNPHSSIRQASKELSISYSSIQRCLKSSGMKSFHLSMVQKLSDDDKCARLLMCEHVIDSIASDKDYLRKILFTDEATFHVGGTVNKFNCRVWGYENPHKTLDHCFQSPKVSIWVGYTTRHLFGPYFFDTTITKDTYLEFLKNVLVPDMKSKGIFLNTILQQDSVPSHWGLNVQQFLNAEFPRRWWGRDGPIFWSPRSPDLTPLDFFFWGYLCDQVYRTAITDIEHLKRRIEEEVMKIQTTLLADSILAVEKRCRLCIEHGGGHFESCTK